MTGTPGKGPGDGIRKWWEESMKDWMNPERLNRLKGSAILLALSAAVGAIAGVLTAVFGHGVLAMTEVREAYPLLMVLLPAGGALICLVYRRWGEECRRGMGLVFDAVEGRRNPQLRQSLCPKRYWPQMVEMEGQ